MDEKPRQKAITLICPNLRCRSLLQVPENVRGKKVRCAKCGKNFIVPSPSQQKATTPPATAPSDMV